MNGFPKNARVCFIGDSITHNNQFVSRVYDYYHQNLKDRNVNFYNCGVGGGRVATALPIMEEDVLSHNPTHAVIMFGVNDSDNRFFSVERSSERYDKLLNAYEVFQANLREMCRRLKEKNVEIILCTQAPYDEYQKCNTPAWQGGFTLMAGYAEAVRNIARELGLPVCDYHKHMTRAMQDEVLHNTDRVHPNDKGQFEMAKCFLEFQGYDIGEYKPIPEYLDKWREKIAIQRNIWMAERLIINKYDLSAQEQIARIKAYVEEFDGDESRKVFVESGKKYLKTKHMQKELYDEINYIMEVEMKKR